MTDVKADVEYKINFNDNAFLLDHKKFKLLEGILNTGSITDASKLIDVSYRTALNYINKIETALNVSVVSTSKGGKGGGGGAILTPEGRSILKECKKINAIMQLHRDVNEIETVVSDIDEDKGVMELTKNDLSIKIPLDRSYALGDNILALISYDNIFIMLEPSTSSIRNIIDGKIVEMKLDGEVIKVRIDVGGVELYSFITLSAEKDLNLTIGKTVYIGFKAMSVATLKLQICYIGVIFILQIEIDEDKCIACGNCYDICPKAAKIWKIGKVAKILDLRYCHVCTLCAMECPVDCIKIIREPPKY